jgi:hypothetical protein
VTEICRPPYSLARKSPLHVSRAIRRNEFVATLAYEVCFSRIALADEMQCLA